VKPSSAHALLAAGLLLAGLMILPRLSRPDRPGPTVLFVVLDTVRADRTSLCGYDKPTTPVLDSLLAQGATVSCGAIAPGAWTLPSHASFFTGLPVWEHGATLAAGGGVGQKLFSFSVHPLPATLPTMAETLRDRGFATALLSENSVVGKKTGLSRGFNYVRSRYRCGKSAEGWLYPELRKLLDHFDGDPRPLFLMVNSCQAHDRRAGAPAWVGWVEHHEGSSFREEAARAFLHGELSPEEETRWLGELSDAYDWGVHRADESLGHVLRALADDGRLDHGLRLVVTSDHGEMLGEHRRIDHMEYLWEPVARVPLLVLDTEKPIHLPDQLTGIAVHDLVVDGRLPDPLPAPIAVSAPSRGRPRQVWTEGWQPTAHAASYAGPDKRMVIDGADLAIDLSTDPGERRPAPAPDDARQRRLHALYDRVQERAGQMGAADTEALLQQLGYVDADATPPAE